jgi:hypothetical protein
MVFRWQNDVEGTSDVEGASDLKYHALFHLHWPAPSELDVLETLECPSRSWSYGTQKTAGHNTLAAKSFSLTVHNRHVACYPYKMSCLQMRM